MWGPGHWAIVCYLANYSVVLRKPEASLRSKGTHAKANKVAGKRANVNAIFTKPQHTHGDEGRYLTRDSEGP